MAGNSHASAKWGAALRGKSNVKPQFKKKQAANPV